MNTRFKNIIVIFLIILVFVLLYFDYVFTIFTTLNKIVFAIAILMGFGILIQKVGSFVGTNFGIYLIGTKKGLNFINILAKKYKTFLNNLAVWGLFLGFGILSYKIFKNQLSKKTIIKVSIIGIISIILISFTLPFLSILTIQLIKIPQINALGGLTQSLSFSGVFSQYLTNYLLDFLLLISIIFGFSGLMFILLFYSTYTILSQIFLSIYKYLLIINSSHPIYISPKNLIPGVVPIIPGIDISLFAGIIALVIIIVIHEFSHGILARSFKIKLKSIGIVLFGIVPIGAYVEPDENKLAKLNKFKQTKVLSAGPSSNFFAFIVFFIPTLLIFIFLLPHIITTGIFIGAVIPNFPASNTLKSGMQIISWDNYNIKNLSDLSVAASIDTPGHIVHVKTNTGSYTFIAKQDPKNSSKGLIGVELIQKQQIKNTLYAKSVYFLYTLFGLLFLLNFFIAIVNLLPIPGLDGWRIYKLNIRNKWFINLLVILIIFAIVVNIIPWFL